MSSKVHITQLEAKYKLQVKDQGKPRKHWIDQVEEIERRKGKSIAKTLG